MSKASPNGQYRFISAALLPVFFAHAAIRGIKDGRLRYLKERLGFYQKDTTPRTWIHAASVGEVLTALPLIQAALDRDDSLKLLVTSNTPTGYKRVRDRLIDSHPTRIIHRYLPIDVGFTTKRLFTQSNINAAWVMETELWPWLYSQATNNGTPVIIINGRLTARTLKAADSWLGKSYKRALANVQVLSRSEHDADGFLKLGASPTRIRTMGDLKFADNRAGDEVQLLNRHYAIAASTHADEELMLARAWLQTADDQLLVIAPRHPERGRQIHKDLTQLCKDLGLDAADALPNLRSTGAEPSPNARVYIADTLGELPSWYAYATAAFVGGSLINRGGHNVLEPMHSAVPIVVGTHTDNFVEATQHLTRHNALYVANDATQAAQYLYLLMTDEEKRIEASAAVKLAASQIDSIVPNYLEALTS